MNFGNKAAAAAKRKTDKENISKHFEALNAENDEKNAVIQAKRLRNEWIAANPEKYAEIEKKQRLRLESERADMASAFRDRMIVHAVNAEISTIIKNG